MVLSLCARPELGRLAGLHYSAPYVYFIDWILDQEEEEPHWIRGSHTLTLYDNKLLSSEVSSGEKRKLPNTHTQ